MKNREAFSRCSSDTLRLLGCIQAKQTPPLYIGGTVHRQIGILREREREREKERKKKGERERERLTNFIYTILVA